MASMARVEGTALQPGAATVVRSFDFQPSSLRSFRLLCDRDRERSISALIEREIIPRLMIAHAGDAAVADRPVVAADPAGITPDEVEALVPLALHVEAEALLAHVDTILARGVTVDSVLVDLLAPAARLLGEYWEEDRCDFVDVTMALWRLQESVHEIAARAPAQRVLAAGGHRALFAAMPGDQHNFGTVVLDEVFRRHGWVTDRMGDADTSAILQKASAEWFDLIGLTVSCDCHIAPLPSIITGLRNVSRNPWVSIMVGGRIFSNEPELAVTVGADGTACDAKLALRVAADLVLLREGEALAHG